MTVRFHGSPATHLTLPALEALGLPHASTTRHCPGAAHPADPASPRVPLAISPAACLPVVVYDPPGGRLALAHVGWRGTVKGAARTAVDALAREGARAGGLPAAILRP